MKKLLITVNGKRYEVDVEVLEDDELNEVQPAFRPPERTVNSYVTPAAASLPPKPKVTVGDSKTLTSPINGVMLEVKVAAGQEVKENDLLFVLEAMKMKTNITSPQPGTVREVRVAAGATVEAGQVLLTFA